MSYENPEFVKILDICGKNFNEFLNENPALINSEKEYSKAYKLKFIYELHKLVDASLNDNTAPCTSTQ